MKLFGFELTRKGAAPPVPVASYANPFWGVIRESFTGAWQRNIVETPQNILAFSAVYACIALIADDVSKLRIKLMAQTDNPEVWNEVASGTSPFQPVLRKPNRYQTRIQFLSQWTTSKLLTGNAYILLERDARGIVTDEYVLNPMLVKVLVGDDGSVFYQINPDYLSGTFEAVTVSASEIIHDRMFTPWHPLVGLSPIYACGMSATQGIKIQRNSSSFFENMSRPSGQLTAPGAIDNPTAARLKEEFEKNFSNGNLGRLLVTGSGLKYEAMTIPPVDAQLIEQLDWTAKDVARCFKIPLHKLGLEQPTLNNIGALNQDYYSQCLQSHIESIELLQDEALGLPKLGMGTELDLDCLLRMDPLSRATRADTLIKAGVLAPNEGRAAENLPPVDGGESPMIQQQNFSLAALAKRDAKEDPFATTTKPAPVAPALPAPTPTPDQQQSAKDLADALIKRFTAVAHG